MKSYHAKGYYAFPINTAAHDRTHAFWEGGFSFEEIERIVKLCEAQPKVQAEVGAKYEGAELYHTRDCQLSWLEPDESALWIYDRFAMIVRELNAKMFGFDLHGFHDGLQYAVYESKTKNGNEGHYDWHIDTFGRANEPVRKLTITMQLSDPMEYEGGELWVNGLLRAALPKGKGMVHVFPSYVLHRVTPVTAGIRRTLTTWAVGPEFR